MQRFSATVWAPALLFSSRPVLIVVDADGIEIVTTWGVNSGLEIESHLQAPGGCLAGPLNDFCFSDDGGFVSYLPNFGLATTHSFELIEASGSYKHVVSGISSSHDWVNSQASVAVYEAGKAPFFALNVEAGGALCRSEVNSEDRFWHTFVFDAGAGRASPIVNEVECSPAKTTGVSLCSCVFGLVGCCPRHLRTLPTA